MPTTKSFSRVVALTLSAMLIVGPGIRAEAMAAPAAGTVRGTVTSAATGEALADVVVRLVDLDAATTVAEGTTGETGSIAFADIAYGTYHVAVVAPEGFIAVPTGLVTVSASTPTVTVVAAVVQAGAAAAGQGKVTAVTESALTIDSAQIMVGPETTYTGPLNSLPAIQAALDGGHKVCAEYVGGQDTPATSVMAEICAGGAGGGGFPPVVLALLGAAAAGYGIGQAVDSGGQRNEVVTQ